MTVPTTAESMHELSYELEYVTSLFFIIVRYFRSALMLASEVGDADAIEVLLSFGASTDLRDKQGKPHNLIVAISFVPSLTTLSSPQKHIFE